MEGTVEEDQEEGSQRQEKGGRKEGTECGKAERTEGGRREEKGAGGEVQGGEAIVYGMAGGWMALTRNGATAKPFREVRSERMYFTTLTRK